MNKTTTEHTPGPWAQADAHGPVPHGTLGGPPDGNPVCGVTGYYGRDGGIANARLTAAAPDLLAALRGLCEAAVPGARRWDAARELLRRIGDAERLN